MNWKPYSTAERRALKGRSAIVANMNSLLDRKYTKIAAISYLVGSTLLFIPGIPNSWRWPGWALVSGIGLLIALVLQRRNYSQTKIM